MPDLGQPKDQAECQFTEGSTSAPFQAFSPVDCDGNCLTSKDIGTVEFWVSPNWTDDKQNRVVLVVDDNSSAVSVLVYVSADRTSLFVGNGKRQTQYTLGVGDAAYHHVAIQVQKKTLFIDGVQQEQNFFIALGGAANPALKLAIGTVPHDRIIDLPHPLQPFNGQIQGLRVWARVLNTDEIVACGKWTSTNTAPPLPPEFSAVAWPTEDHADPYPLLAYQVANQIHVHLESGSWVSREDNDLDAPRLLPVAGKASYEHCQFQKSRYFALARSPIDKKLVLIGSNMGPWVLTPVKSIPGSYTITALDGSAGGTLKVHADGSGLNATLGRGISADHFPATGEYQRVVSKLNRPVVAGKATWISSFNASRPVLRPGYFGWSLEDANLPPVNNSTGASKMALHYPDDGSFDYELINGEFVPYGFFYVSEPHSSQSFTSASSNTESGYAQQVSSATGSSLKVEGSAKVMGASVSAHMSITNNKSVANESKNSSSDGKAVSTTSMIETTHCLVLDKPNNRVSEKFKEAVALVGTQGANGNLANFNVTAVNQLFSDFGTILPNAITYGGRATVTTVHTHAELSRYISHGVNISRSLEIGAKAKYENKLTDSGGEAGATHSNTSDSDNTSSKSLSKTLEDEARNYESFGSLSIISGNAAEGPGDKIPILLDFIPITELLGPPFFNDYFTAVTLRTRLDEALIQRLTGTPLSSEPSTRFYEVKIAKFLMHDPEMRSVSPLTNAVSLMYDWITLSLVGLDDPIGAESTRLIDNYPFHGKTLRDANGDSALMAQLIAYGKDVNHQQPQLYLNQFNVSTNQDDSGRPRNDKAVRAVGKDAPRYKVIIDRNSIDFYNLYSDAHPGDIQDSTTLEFAAITSQAPVSATSIIIPIYDGHGNKNSFFIEAVFELSELPLEDAFSGLVD